MCLQVIDRSGTTKSEQHTWSPWYLELKFILKYAGYIYFMQYISIKWSPQNLSEICK